ncbi:TPA: hypothetical protein ACPPGA_001751 [Haemophilus influenzae]
MKETEMLLEKAKEKFKERYIELYKNDYEIEYEYKGNEDEESEGFTQTDFEVEKSLVVFEEVFEYIVNRLSLSKEIDEGVYKEIYIQKMSCEELKREIEVLQKEKDKRCKDSKRLTHQQK